MVAAASELVDRGVGAVLATLGAAGAVLVEQHRRLARHAPAHRPRSTVGAGDSSLAGYLRADIAGADAAARLRMAVAYGSAAAALPGSALPPPAQFDLDAVRVTSISPITTLTNSAPDNTHRKCRHDQHHLPTITTDLVLLDVDAGADKQAVIGRLAGGSPTPGAPPTPTG